eukprot:COSAG05_NODE_2129_length_3516_cov_3.306612_4_plen_304_part_00
MLSTITTEFAYCRDVFERFGCFVVDDAVEPSMLPELEAAARRVVARVQSGEDDFSLHAAGNGPEATQISGLIAPEYGEPVFQEMMSSDALARYYTLLPPPVRLWFCAMWCLNENQQKYEYDSKWHRDTSGILGTTWDEDVDEQRELDILGASPEQVGRSLKWTTCLNECDPCLFVCPGSHRRYRTPDERRALVEAPSSPIDGELQVVLRRGQTVFWAGTLVHRGLKPPDCRERLSMTCGLQAHNRADVPLHKGHQWAWCKAPNIGPTLQPRMRGFWDRWLEACDDGAAEEALALRHAPPAARL